MMLKYDAGLIVLNEFEKKFGNADGQYSVNSLDAELVLRYDAGIISGF